MYYKVKQKLKLIKLWILNANLKTIYFNLKYFPIAIAIKLPVFISSKTYLRKLKGTITIESQKIHTGMIRIGKKNVGVFDEKNSRSILEIRGKIVFKGKAFIGHGSKISVYNGALLELGNNLIITAESTIIAAKKIVFKEDCILSWEILIMDTDFHKIYNIDLKRMNDDADIFIGQKVWIGCRSTILKGTILPDNTVVAAGSIVTGEFHQPGTIIAGIPAKNIKSISYWTF